MNLVARKMSVLYPPDQAEQSSGGADLPLCLGATKRLRTAVYSLPLGRRRQSVNGKPSFRMRLVSAVRHHILNRAQVWYH